MNNPLLVRCSCGHDFFFRQEAVNKCPKCNAEYQNHRSHQVQKVVNAFAKAAFGRTMKKPCCVACGSTKITPEDFQDALSWKEFHISHMCQQCQDSIFAPPLAEKE